MTSHDDAQLATFAANRATGTVRFDLQHLDGVTRRNRLYEAGSMRVRFPTPEGCGLSAMLINTAGGIAGGDCFDVSVSAGKNTQICVTTASAEKIYRSHGPMGAINVALSGAAGSHISWLPQETIVFNQARIARSFDITLSNWASLLFAEILVLGRAAMGEVLRSGLVRDSWRLRVDDRLVFADNIVLDGDLQMKLGRRAVTSGGLCVGTALIVPGDLALVASIRETVGVLRGEFGISAWNGFAVARFCAAEAASVRQDMMQVLTRVSPVSLPRMWMS